ncbi:MAG TPA: hypothetical protein VJX67_22400 [Blastocatellia bacterium]|nr:hypothetical protein [Blastocatellia bacterium]
MGWLTCCRSGPSPQPFEGHFGLRAKGGINKPSYYDFGLLHKLGDRRVANAASNVIVTKRKDGTLAIAVWNLVDPGKTGSIRTIRLIFNGVRGGANVAISRVDDEHGNTLAAYKTMGSPRYPTEDQIRQLNAATELPPPGRRHLDGNHLDLSLEASALVLVEVEAGQ